MGKSVYLALALVALLGAGLRLYHLGTVPTELIVDEIDLYNSAYSIVTTGHDVDGTLKPFLYSKYTRNPPLYGFAAYTSSLVFGKTPFGLRFPAAVFGVLTICVYGIGYELTGDAGIGILAALFTAVQPLFIQFSRIGWEPSCELPFLLGGLYLLLRAIRGRRGAYYGAAVVLGIAAYTYMTAWFYTVILAGALVLLNLRRVRTAWKPLLAAGALWFAVAAPALWMCFFDPLTASKVSRIGTHSLSTFAANYLAHFNFSYLAIDGDPHAGTTWRYLNGFGAFLWWILPLAAVGLVAMRRYVESVPLRVWLAVWLLAYPLAGALTNDGVPNAPRTLAGAPVFCLLAAIGLRALPLQSKPLFAAASAAVMAFSFGTFSKYYFTQYVHRDPNAWDSGTRAMFQAVAEHRSGYKRVCFSVLPAWYGIDTYVRFYMPADPDVIENAGDPRCRLPGTLLVTDNARRALFKGYTRIETVKDVDGNGFAVLSGKRGLRG